MSTEALPADLVAMLRCPQTGQPLTLAPPELVAAVNGRIACPETGGATNHAGNAVREALDGALLRQDGSAIYPVRAGIAVLLIDEAMAMPLP